MRELQHETPVVQDEEPEWVQRMRAKGYNIRRGTGPAMSEIPDAMFPPPVHRVRRRIALIGRGIRRVLRLDASTTMGPDASLS
jgi:hypothetical protein